MRIVTWNMGRARGAWDHLLGELKPDFALLQETYGGDGRPGSICWHPIGENSVKYGERATYRWGSAVWSRDAELREVTVGAPSGWVVAAQPTTGERLTFISAHVELDAAGRSIPILHRMLSDLTPTLEKRGKFVFGGDLNADVTFDEQYGTRRHAIALERIEDLGLWHCNRLIPPGRRRTFRGRSKGPVMDDHLFVSTSMAERVTSCEVVADLSAPGDHFPVVIELG